jgi:hypothetical protein
MVIEIFQYHLDETFWILSQQLGLRHFCLLGLYPEEIKKLKDSFFANTEGRYATSELDLKNLEHQMEHLKIIFESVYNASQIERLC